MQKRIRTLVVDDSLTVRRFLCDVLGADHEIEVVGEAADGPGAIEACARLRPDVMTLDMMLPGLNGAEVTEHVMAHFPTPILVVSASINRGELFRTYDALTAGAVDVLEKSTDGSEEWAQKLRAAVKLVARVRVITHLRGRLGPLARDPSIRAPGPASAAACAVIGVGTSTGGPSALIDLLRSIPAPCPVPILIVLHIDAPFANTLAQWLDRESGHHVVCAQDGERLSRLAGTVVMAPAEHHMIVRGGRVALTSDAPRHSCRPSVDVLFESLADELGETAWACLLTGMGKDGAAGMLRVRAAGGLTIAQDRETSVVYGMPCEALRIGGAERVLPLPRIGPELMTALAQRGLAAGKR